MTFKLTFKISLLIVVLVLSLISIFNGAMQYKLMILALLLMFFVSSKFKLKKLSLLFVFLIVLSFIFLIQSSLSPKGVIISSVEKNSTAFEQGFRQGQLIFSMDNEEINNLNDYSSIIQSKFSTNEKTKVIFQTSAGEIIYFSDEPPNIVVSKIPKTRIQTGLDLRGGSRALVKAQNKSLSSQEITDLVDVLSNRINVYGITDVNIKPVSDLSGNNFVLIEIAGATPKDLKDLISKQGKFEAKIGNQTVFIGGEKDITSVGRSAKDSRVESCQKSGDAYVCRFSFTVFLSQAAAERQAELTKNLTINETNPNYLSKKLDLYLDDKLIDSLFIGKDLRGSVTTQIMISGSGTGPTEEDAYKDAIKAMNRLQTILITGSLPYKLEIVKLDTISPTLGEDFLKSIFIASIFALIAVSLIIFFRYKNIKSSLLLISISISEIIIILGIAAIIKWNLDLPSIAGILATIGTGLDDLIVILDEAQSNISISLKQRLKKAFAIILGSYFTTVVSLLPLMWAGAGLLKGFAITTIIGISVGILITRPAFSDLIKVTRQE